MFPACTSTQAPARSPGPCGRKLGFLMQMDATAPASRFHHARGPSGLQPPAHSPRHDADLAGSLVKISSMTSAIRSPRAFLVPNARRRNRRANDRKQVTAIAVAPMPSDRRTILHSTSPRRLPQFGRVHRHVGVRAKAQWPAQIRRTKVLAKGRPMAVVHRRSQHQCQVYARPARGGAG
jgi:hypothetical protein